MMRWRRSIPPVPGTLRLRFKFAWLPVYLEDLKQTIWLEPYQQLEVFRWTGLNGSIHFGSWGWEQVQLLPGDYKVPRELLLTTQINTQKMYAEDPRQRDEWAAFRKTDRFDRGQR